MSEFEPNITNVEKQVPIAADSGIAIQNYLDELNTLLIQGGISNAFGIVTDTQDIIVDLLKNQGSATKLGENKVMELIYKELGTPAHFLQSYLNEYQVNLDQISIDGDSRKLVRRPNKKIKVKTPRNSIFKDWMFATFRVVIAVIPVILILIGTLPYALTDAGRGVWFMYEASIFFFVGVIFYVIQEIITGISGHLLVSKKWSIRIRDGMRGLVFVHLLWFFFHINAAIWTGNFYGYGDTTSIFWWIVISWFSMELVIAFRDMKGGWYPLESEPRKKIRFLTPHYLLLIACIPFIPGISIDNDLAPVVFGMSTLAAFIVLYKQYSVSIRYWILFAALQIMSIQSSEYIIIYVFILPSIWILNKILRTIKLNINFPSKIAEKYSEYYQEAKSD